jgi:hypothetical protein
VLWIDSAWLELDVFTQVPGSFRDGVSSYKYSKLIMRQRLGVEDRHNSRRYQNYMMEWLLGFFPRQLPIFPTART